MNLKRIKYTIIMAIAVIAFASCNEDFIDIAPQSDLGVNGFYRNADDIEQAVVGIYASLQPAGQYNYNYPHLFEMRSDNSTIEDQNRSGARYGQIDLFQVVAANPVLKSTWSSCYKTIQRCNVVISRIDGIEMDEQIKDYRKGEALFIRALTYFNMVRIWGGIPLVLEETENPFDEFERGRSTMEETYQAIEEDLSKSINLLPKDINKSDVGRATKGAAQALLGKVLLSSKKYSEAVTVLDALIKSGKYSLTSNYSNIFGPDNENGIESIFEVQYKEGGSGLGSRFPNLFAPTGAVELVGGIGSSIGDNIPTQSMIDAYENDDLRKDASIGILADGRYYCKKFLDTPFKDYDSDVNSIVLRYADVLLMQAEAMNEVAYSGSGDAYTYLNAVRNRAGLQALSSTDLPDQSGFREAVFKERRVELAFENHRWPDLVRTGKAIDAMDNAGILIKAYQLLYPIPEDEISKNPEVMVQNDGY